MAIQRFRQAAVLGTGMMGPGIALTLANGGVRTTIVGRTMESALAGLEKARAQFALLFEHGLLEDASAVSLLSATDCLEEVVPGCDLVIESHPENLELKQDLFAALDSIAPDHAVLASNTSGISIRAIAAKCRLQERVMTTHFWNPPYLMPLVEIVCAERTSLERAEEVRALLQHCGKTPVMVRKDRPGQLGNRLQMALWREAFYCVQDGIATADEVDLVVKTGMGLRLPVYGIFEHADSNGLELVRAVMTNATPDLFNEPAPPPILADLIAAGKTGASAGQGFLDWAKHDIKAVRERRDKFLLDFLLRYYSPAKPETASS